MIGADLHAGSASDYIIEFVLVVWLLRIAGALGQNIDAGAHRRNTQKFEVALALGGAVAREVIEMEEMSHESQLRATSMLCQPLTACLLLRSEERRVGK